MGIKILSLQTITWCFQMMLGGGAASPDFDPDGGAAASAGGDSLKLIKPDGGVEIFHQPVSASELMILHPNYLLCRSDSFTIGQKLPAIQEEEILQLGHSYFLLPSQFFQSVLSFAAIARASAIKGGKFDVHKTPSGKLQIRVSEDFSDRTKQVATRVCTTAALEKDYQKLVAGEKTKQWKPKLETIMEAQMKKGRLVFGAMAFVGIKKRGFDQQESSLSGRRRTLRSR